MPPHSSDRLGMPSLAFHSLVQTTDVTLRVSASMHHPHVGPFGVRPLEVVVDVSARPSVPNMSSTGMHSRRHAGVRSQVTRTRESADISYLREDDQILCRRAMLLPYANIIFDLERAAALKTVHGYLDDIGIAYCGRYGDWGYLWTDDSFKSGELAAERVLSML